MSKQSETNKKKDKDAKEPKHDKHKKPDIPSLKEFKSGLEAKVTSIRDAKVGLHKLNLVDPQLDERA